MKATKHDVEDLGDGSATITGTCPITGKEWNLTVDLSAYESWVNQEKLIQEAFPNLTPDLREMLMTGYSPEGWNLMFGNVREEKSESQEILEAYDYQCPDCGEAIDLDVVEGEECGNCGHVFWLGHGED
jgi:hypothetical protein